MSHANEHHNTFWDRLRQTNAALITAIIFSVITIIFLAIALGFGANANSNINTLQTKLCTGTQSILCTDFNPCTADLITYISCDDTNVSGCLQFKCKYVPLANGSCCNDNDFCYRNDPSKVCFYGKCVSPNPTVCKGFCTTAGDCPILPIVDTDAAIDYDCIYNSCVTTTVIISDNVITYPYNILDNSTLANLNTSSCLSASCYYVSNSTPAFSVCTFTWSCSVFVNFESPPIEFRKR